MKRMTMVVVGAMLISAVGMYAQAKPAAPTDQKTITGCVVPGSNNDSFKLVNGKQKGQKGNETATYGLVPENKDVDIRRFQTMEVEVTAQWRARPTRWSSRSQRSSAGPTTAARRDVSSTTAIPGRAATARPELQ